MRWWSLWTVTAANNLKLTKVTQTFGCYKLSKKLERLACQDHIVQKHVGAAVPIGVENINGFNLGE